MNSRKPLVILAGFLLILLCTYACVMPVARPPVIKGITHAQEICASFETAIAYNPVNSSNAALSYIWTAENGTIKGEGQHVVWVPPDKPGKYTIAVKVKDPAGEVDSDNITVEVVPFEVTDIEASPEIVLRIQSNGAASSSTRVCMRPVTTAEISCAAPENFTGKYTYKWLSNGGKLTGPGLKEGTANRVGWTSPGVAGYYSVMVEARDSQGNISLGNVYIFVRAPFCGEAGSPCQVTK